MMTKIENRYEPRPFACLGCGKVLGWIVRRGNVTHLDILRIPNDAGSQMPRCDPGDIDYNGDDFAKDMADQGDGLDAYSPWSWRGLPLEGHVPCTCGKSRKWVAGDAAMERLLSRKPGALKKYQKLAE
jgi:hypothetical protein